MNIRLFIIFILLTTGAFAQLPPATNPRPSVAVLIESADTSSNMTKVAYGEGAVNLTWTNPASAVTCYALTGRWYRRNMLSIWGPCFQCPSTSTNWLVNIGLTNQYVTPPPPPYVDTYGIGTNTFLTTTNGGSDLTMMFRSKLTDTVGCTDIQFTTNLSTGFKSGFTYVPGTNATLLWHQRTLLAN